MSTTLHIFRKEALEMLRDKRVRSGAIVMPIVMMLVIMFLFGFLTDTLSKKSNIKVHVIGSGPLVDALKKAKVNVVTLGSVKEAEEKIKKGEIKIALEMPNPVNASGNQITIRAYFDPKDDKAKVNVAQLGAIYGEQNRIQLEKLMVEQGLPKEASQPIKFEEKPIKVGQEEGASGFIIGILPYLIVIYAFYGGMGSVADLVAGEKEKMTLETLLITPASRSEVALGKFYALAMLCLASSLSAVAGLFIAGSLKLDMMARLFPTGLGVTPKAFGITLLALIPAVAFFAAIMLAASTKSKNVREAQTQLTLISLVVLMPAMFSQFIGYTDWAQELWVQAVPVLNTASAIRSALQGKYDMVGLLIGIVVNGLIALIALRYAIQLFKKEDVLVRV